MAKVKDHFINGLPEKFFSTDHCLLFLQGLAALLEKEHGDCIGTEVNVFGDNVQLTIDSTFIKIYITYRWMRIKGSGSDRELRLSNADKDGYTESYICIAPK